MKYFLKILILMLLLTQSVWTQNELLFFQTNWGFEGSWEAFFLKTKSSGYDGVEVWLPKNARVQQEVSKGLKKHQLKVIYLCGTNKSLSFKESLLAYENDLKRAIVQKPYAINSHTGSDFFSFEQNMKFLKLANDLSNKYNIPIHHETHRGRFSYALPETKRYLNSDSAFRLTLDISHWMVVHESLLAQQQQLLDEVMERTDHIHARVGFEEGPQVNNPQAPEWDKALNRHLSIWESIILSHWKTGKPMTITTEFGPPNYLPTAPFTQKPLSDQWEANVFIMKAIKEQMNISN
jgi:sugar phosphate isomerase/epimerase